MNNTEREQVEEIKESLVLFVKSDDAGEALAGRLMKTLLAIIERQEKEIGRLKGQCDCDFCRTALKEQP